MKINYWQSTVLWDLDLFDDIQKEPLPPEKAVSNSTTFRDSEHWQQAATELTRNYKDNIIKLSQAW